MGVLIRACIDLYQIWRKHWRWSVHTILKRVQIYSSVSKRQRLKVESSWAIRPKNLTLTLSGLLWFNRKWMFRILAFAECHIAPACKISRQSAHVRLSYWQLNQAFTRFLGVPPKRRRCFEKGVDRSIQIWWEHCPIIATHSCSKWHRYFTSFRNDSG